MIPKVAKTLDQYITDYIEFRRAQGTPHGTLKEFITAQNRIKTFDENRGKKTVFRDINLVWADEFEQHLRTRKTEDGQTVYQDGTIQKTFVILRTILNHFYERRDEMKIDLSDKFRSKRFMRGTKSVNEPQPLTRDQLWILYRHNFKDPDIERTRDRFCLQCSTGLRYSDLFRISPENINEGQRGIWLRLKPVKTERYQVEVRQPLNQISRKILGRYGYDTSPLKITNQAYNRSLRQMFVILQSEYPNAGFLPFYSSHNGRDSFISLAVQAGVNFKTILLWSGQSSYAIMDRYVSIIAESQEEDMSKVF